ncbi:hypothetical protein MMC24_004378 [Lignoscripta atroalba]|nr:hypothetical protein [Lignoscripta atroalba]
MSHIAVPKTPTPDPVVYLSRATSTPVSKGTEVNDSQDEDLRYRSPPPLSGSDLTPPPSSQVPKQSAKAVHPDLVHHALLASPPATLKVLPLSLTGPASKAVPNIDQLGELSEHQLRGLVSELLPALSEARMAAAHAKLQHNLLTIESAEAAKRAAVEHEMTRREVEVLQAGHLLHRGPAIAYNGPMSPQEATQRHLDFAVKRCRDLKAEIVLLERRLKQAKTVIKHIDGKNSQLVEDNQLLRERIKQNRDNIDAMRSSGALSVNGTPRTTSNTPSHRSTSRISSGNRIDGQDPFDALLFAGQVLNAEINSVPATPTYPRQMKLHPGHIRGAHSLSSLQTTPNRRRPSTADNTLHTPILRNTQNARVSFSVTNTQPLPRQDRRREDRDSTISASDHEEEAYTDDDVPASQASRVATSMLRRYSGVQPQGTVHAAQFEPFVQSKILGKVTKPGFNKIQDQEKRMANMNGSDGDIRASKKPRVDEETAEQMRVGIGVWPSPGR